MNTPRKARTWSNNDRICLGSREPTTETGSVWNNIASYQHIRWLIERNGGSVTHQLLMDTIHHVDTAETRPTEKVGQEASNRNFIQHAWRMRWLDLVP